jgi:hypothetical protein
MSIKYKFMAMGLTQAELAALVAARMEADGVDMVCDRSCVSLTMTKQAKGIPLTEKEGIVYRYLLDILEALNGKENT